MDLDQLLGLPGVEEQSLLRSRVGVMALHAGSQDRGTDHIAATVAERSGSSYYAIVQPPTLRVHLTSRLHDPLHSPALRAFLDHVDIALSIHGFGRDSFALWIDHERGPILEPYGPATRGRQVDPLTGIIVGGANDALLRRARQMLHGRIEGFHVADERVRLGFHPDNPVNLPRRHGVQIELPPGLRGIGPYGDHPTPQLDAIPSELLDVLVELAGEARRIADRADCPQNENVF